jgi:iron(III) transport system substrate-binding protein
MNIKKLFNTLIIALAITSTSLLAATETDTALVIYSGRSEALVGPLFKQFTDKTGIQVDVRYNDTGPLATQALVEGDKTPADVFFFQESGYLSLLGKQGLLQPLPDNLLTDIPANFQDKQQYWVATSARARVLAYNTQKLKPADLPASLKDLTDSQWKKKMGWAPSNASLQAHISALRHLWGEQETATWLKEFVANEPTSYPKNAAQVLAVGRGEIDLAWVNHYYLYQLKKQQPDLPVANYSFTNKADAGNILILSGISIRKNTPKQTQAEKLVEFLLSPQAQTYLAEEAFEYPTRTGIPTNKEVPPLEALNLATVDQAWLVDVQPTLTLLQQVGAL